MLFASKWNICKGKFGAFQASLIPPTWVKDDKGNSKVTREGSIMIEMAKVLRKEGDIYFYDWSKEKKVSISLGVPDICRIVDAGDTEFSLVHTTDKGTKTMFFKPGKGDYEGTMNMNLIHKKPDGETNSVNIAFSYGEWAVFTKLIENQVDSMLGWDKVCLVEQTQTPMPPVFEG